MATVGGSEGQARPHAKRSWIRRIASVGWSFVLLLGFIFIGFQIGGFVRFLDVVTTPTATSTETADAIVVLTGGENRLEAGMELLAKGRGERLLITGVNPTTSEATLRAASDVDDALFACCVEVDRVARDTIGNAIATRAWATKNDVSSLIVVTGAFHMPRAMQEFSHTLKDVELIAHPANVPDQPDWWRDPGRVRDLLREYAKFAVVRLRDRINPLIGRAWPNMPLQKERPTGETG
ncbi:MAG: YdcF family protein [Pseudomonadota bacterium]